MCLYDIGLIYKCVSMLKNNYKLLQNSNSKIPPYACFALKRFVFVTVCVCICCLTKLPLVAEYLMLSLWLQLPHGLPPTSLNLETEVEKQFLRDPAWLPIHDTDFAFQKFLKYIFLYASWYCWLTLWLNNWWYVCLTVCAGCFYSLLCSVHMLSFQVYNWIFT